MTTEPVHRIQTASTVTIVAREVGPQPVVVVAAQTHVNGGETVNVTMEAQEEHNTARWTRIARIVGTAARSVMLVGVAPIAAGTQVS
jgi:hypothetical protein